MLAGLNIFPFPANSPSPQIPRPDYANTLPFRAPILSSPHTREVAIGSRSKGKA